MTYSQITLETDAQNVATITLNREEKHNAMNSRMMGELKDVCGVLAHNDKIRAVVLTGSGEKSFSAGADLGWMKENFARTRSERIAESALLADTLEALNKLNKITIARVNGQAYAGGVGLIAVCDIAISVSTAKFSLTETRLGLTPANISPYILSRTGLSNSRRILLNAHTFSALEGLQLGLLHKVVEPGQLDNALQQEIEACLVCAPGAIAMTKALLARVNAQSHEENKHYTAELLADAWETAEAQSGIKSFFERTSPPWVKD